MTEPWDDPVAALAKRFAAGDRTALLEAYERYSPAVLHLARATLTDVQRAEQVTRDTFVTAWAERETYDPARGSLLGWLLGIVRRDTDPTRSGLTTRVIEQLLIADELAHLRPLRRWMLELVLVDKLTYEQVARLTGMSRAAVEQSIGTGMRSLRRRVEAERGTQP